MVSLSNSSSPPREHDASRRVGLIAVSAHTNYIQFAFYWPSAFSYARHLSYVMRKQERDGIISKSDIVKWKFHVQIFDISTFRIHSSFAMRNEEVE